MNFKIIILLLIAVGLTGCNLFFGDSNSSNKKTPIFSEKLIAYFPFNEDANDVGPNSLHGTVHGATSIQGAKKNGYYFDGIDDFIEIENSHELFNFNAHDHYSISFWIKPDSIQQDVDVHESDILTKWVQKTRDTLHLQTGYPFCFRYLNQTKGKDHGKFYVANYGGNFTDCGQSDKVMSAHNLSFDKFNHVAFVQTEKVMILFLNGKQVAVTSRQSTCPTSNTANLRIGKRGGMNYQNHFSGIIDELAFYKGALSKEEVKEIMNY